MKPEFRNGGRVPARVESRLYLNVSSNLLLELVQLQFPEPGKVFVFVSGGQFLGQMIDPLYESVPAHYDGVTSATITKVEGR